MKIAMVSEHASPLAALGGVDAGGQNVHVAALSMAMARRGHDVTVYTRRDDATLARRVRMAPNLVVEHVDAGPAKVLPKDQLLPHMPAFARYVRRAWEKRTPDVVHAHFWMSGIAALDAAAGEIPVVQTFHALGIEKKRFQGPKDTSPEQRLAIEEEIVRRADRIVATASAEVFELLRLGADPRRLKIVPCGVDLAHFTPDGPAEKRKRGRRRIVTLSRLVERKGIGNVIEALAEIPDAELIIAGGGEGPDLLTDPEALRLAGIAKRLGVADRVYMRGRVTRDEIPPLLRSADVVVCTPWYEPFGIVPLEAMACGVPVVASAVGGLIDTVVDGLTGLHVPPREPKQIAYAVRTLLGDEERRKRLGAFALERARSRYSWERIADETLDVYRTLIVTAPARVSTQLA